MSEEQQNLQNHESNSQVREVSIVKRSTKIDSDEYVSVQLKSADDSIEKLLKKAVQASVLYAPQKGITTNGVQ